MNIAERLVNYCQDIMNKKIPACKKHIQAVERFLKDLELSQTEDFPFEFDFETVEDFHEWSKLFRHTKGKLAGQFIEIVDVQIFIIANIFGWKNKKTGYRRFKKSYIQLARKNAKSQLLSLEASFEAFLSNEKSEVYIAGWDKEKSNIVYKEILSQIKQCDLLKGKFSDSYHTITHLKSGSIIKALSRDAKNLDGLNPSFCVIDEYHGHKTSEIYDVLISGMAARPNAHISIITTAGFDLSSPCYTEYKYISRILDPHDPTTNEEYFALVCELDEEDDIKDENNWLKPNPIVATYEEGLNFLRSELQQALDVPEKQRNVYTKNFNLWMQSKANGYLPLDKWEECGEDFTLADFEGMPCIIGVDLSAKIDLTSLSFLFVKDGLLYVFNHSFMPEDTVFEKQKTDKGHYSLWVNQGHITATTGAVVDYKFLENYIEEMARKHNLKIKEICSDPWNATQFMQNLEHKGFLTVEIRQGHQTLGAPTINFRERVFAKTVRHNRNPVLTWSIGNAITRMDANQNIMLDKSKSTERIDPIASVMNAHTRTSILENNEMDINSYILDDDFSF